MPLLENISFANIPRTSPFYCDFLDDWPRVKPFFEIPWRPAELTEAWLKRGFLPSVDRVSLTQVLEDQNTRLQAGPMTMENIRRLGDSSCLAVVTGQQVGLFTGPSYTIYKALTAIKYAETLTQTGLPAVPVFWMASEDHDWAEIDHVELPDAEGNLKEIQYPADSAWAGAPVGTLPIGSVMEESRGEFIGAFPPSEFKDALGEMLGRHYTTGKTFAQAFGGVLAELFRPWGLIVIDPSDFRFKQLAAPLFKRVLSEATLLGQQIRSQGALIESSGYSCQVIVEDDALPLFLIEKGKRRLLMKQGELFRLKGEEISFSLDELLLRLSRSPGDFSPNVLLRPLYQDRLLPVVAYVGGPAEISYFAQVAALYRWSGQPMPAICPRVSYTLIERKIQRVLEKYQLSLPDFFPGLESCLKKVIEGSVGIHSAQALEEAENQMARILDDLQPALQAVDPTLVEALKNSRGKILYQISNLRTRFVNAHARQNEALTRQLARAFQLLYPDKNFQERQINFFYFLSRYGVGLLNSLFHEVDLTSGAHRILAP